jgi:ribonuclease HI
MIEVFFDGACDPNPGGIAGYGFVVRRGGKKVHEGHGLAGTPNSPQATNNLAEYTAVLRALEYLAGEKVDEPVVVRGDSELVVRQLNGEWKIKSANLVGLYHEVGKLAGRMPSVRFEHIPRERNAEADRLSVLAIAEYRGGRLPPPTTDKMVVDLVIAAQQAKVAPALRRAGLEARATAVPGGTRVQCDLAAEEGALRPLLELKRRLEGSA